MTKYNNIKKLMKQTTPKTTYEKLEKIVCYSRSYVCNAINGRFPMPPSMLKDLANYFKVTPEELIGGSK